MYQKRQSITAIDLDTNLNPVQDNGHSVQDIVSESLISTKLQILKLKDFGNEIRCKRDIDIFVKNPNILLDCEEINLESLIVKMLSQLLNDCKIKDFITEAKNAIFAQNTELLMNTIQGIYISVDRKYQYDQSWMSTYCSLPSLTKRFICIARLLHPNNLGIASHAVKFFVLILTPLEEKTTKNAEETGYTFATLFADINFRQSLVNANDEQQFLSIIKKRSDDLSNKIQLNSTHKDFAKTLESKQNTKNSSFGFGNGLIENFKRRYGYYWSDFVDGVVGHKTIHKTTAAIFSLYFACILPSIAFGVLDDKNTGGLIDARRTLIGQTFGGCIFALLGGQPLVVILTTAPLCLYTKVVFDIATDLEVEFYDMFACVGLWNAFFVIMYALFDVSVLMKWCTRSTEEIFSVFTFITFSYNAIEDCRKSFNDHYCISEATNQSVSDILSIARESDTIGCAQQNSVLHLLLMLSTAWLAVTLYNFKKTPFLNSNKREILADYALPIAVLGFSFVGSFCFRDIKVEAFKFSDSFEFTITKFSSLTTKSVFIGMVLGFGLSLLFFMDQNISAAIVNSPKNNLKKGGAYHWDLLVVGLINIFLSIFGLPWMNGMLPQSPIHARSLADVESHVSDGYVKDVVVRVRETRITGFITNVLIGLSILLIPHPLDYIPISVLDGLFIYCAIASLRDNSFFDRILLLVTEQTAYPPTHYVRRVAQKKIHIFTVAQVIQLTILCLMGFAPSAYIQMVFPVIIAILLPIRWKFIPLILDEKVMDAIDGYD